MTKIDGYVVVLSVVAGGAIIDAVIILAPTAIMLRLGYPKISLVLAILTTIAIWYDHTRNFASINYPHWIFALPDFMYPLTILLCFGAIALAIRAILQGL